LGNFFGVFVVFCDEEFFVGRRDPILIGYVLLGDERAVEALATLEDAHDGIAQAGLLQCVAHRVLEVVALTLNGRRAGALNDDVAVAVRVLDTHFCRAEFEKMAINDVHVCSFAFGCYALVASERLSSG